MPDDEIYAYGVFQGGGAKGYAHVGALKAAERVGIRFLGIAGTSAGAVVAALAAAGYTADEMVDPVSRKHLLGDGSPVELFSAFDWTLVRLTRRVLASKLVAWFRPVILLAAGFFVAVWWAVSRRRGLLDSKRLVETINALLVRKIAENRRTRNESAPLDPYVRFRDLSRLQPGCTPLKIIATDLTHNRLVVFSVEDTPDVIVAQAVAASFAVPLLFKPVSIAWPGEEAALYVDGGLASNLPVWVFSEEKRADARARDALIPVVAFAFEEHAGNARNRLGLGEFISRIAAAALSTGQRVSRDFIDDLIVVPIRCELSMLEIDASLASVTEACRNAARSTFSRLDYLLRRRPQALNVALEGVHHVARDVIAGYGETHHLRVALIEPVRSRYGVAPPLNFRVTATYNFGGDTDDRLALDASNQGAPLAYERGEPTLWRPDADWRTRSLPELRMTKYERALVPTHLASAIQIPIFAKSDPDGFSGGRKETLGVVSLDSDKDLTRLSNDVGAMSALTTETLLVADAFKSR